jgi:CHAD domain-containing protein
MPQSPRALVSRHETDFRRQLPLIRDGDIDAIHQGRVATRRLREGLRLFDDDGRGRVRQALDTARATGRTLGLVRELDVLADVLRRYELRLPAAAAAAATVAAALRSEQRDARRQMIKSLDRIDLMALRVDELPGPRQWIPLRQGRWRNRLMGRLHRLGSRLEDVLTHASGVYLPKRSHRLRVVVKKLRYAVEAACETGTWQPPAALGVLRRAQSRLGDLHDLHIAHQRLNPDRVDAGVREQASILRDVIAAELDRRQQSSGSAGPAARGMDDASNEHAHGRSGVTRHCRALGAVGTRARCRRPNG